MRAVSSDFAPPLKLIAPFFRTGVIFYAIAAVSLLFFSPDFVATQMPIAGWAHLFMLGFVMMIIFGAMAQLIPVVLETGHVAVDVYYVIYPMLTLGIVGMVGGFWLDSALLPYGGLLVLSAMVTFAVESFATLRKSDRSGLTVKTVRYANVFLLAGIVSGFTAALVLQGSISIRLMPLVQVHVVAVLGGYVLLTVMGFSLVLLPMFSLAHGFDERPVQRAFSLVSTGTTTVMVGSFFLPVGAKVGYAMIFVGMVWYIYQVALIAKLTVRKEWDVWAKSMVFSFASLVVSLACWILWSIRNDTVWLHTGVWFFLAGFVGFLIIGHLYKIIPFLVWFERFSPLVGKQKVPMLHEMYSKRGARFMFNFLAPGTVAVGIALALQSETLFRAGASFLFIGAVLLVVTIEKIIRFKA